MPSPLLILGILLALSVAGNALLSKLYVGAKQEVARVQQAYDSFTAQVKEAGVQAQKAADARKSADIQAKRNADAENAKTVAALTASIGKLRAERDSRTNRDFLPAPAPGTTGADTACFNRTLYLGAYGNLVTGLRSLSDEGSAAVADLNSAKAWASRE